MRSEIRSPNSFVPRTTNAISNVSSRVYWCCLSVGCVPNLGLEVVVVIDKVGSVVFHGRMEAMLALIRSLGVGDDVAVEAAELDMNWDSSFLMAKKCAGLCGSLITVA